MLPGSSKTQPERVQLGDIRVQNWVPKRGVDGLYRFLFSPLKTLYLARDTNEYYTDIAEPYLSR